MTERPYLDEWANGLRIEHVAHRRACARSERLGRWLGVAVVILATVVGTSVFSTIKSSPGTAVRVLAGLLSIAAAVLAAVQTFLGFEARAAQHREAATRYGTLRRELEQLRAAASLDEEAIATIRTRWDEIDGSSPAVSSRLHERARRIVLQSLN
jgi:hypothetical protein